MKKLFLVLLFGFLVFVLYGFYTWRFLNKDKIIDTNSFEYVKSIGNGYQLIRNSNPFYIIGASGNSYFKELADIGGNTVRVYDTINLDNVLNDAYKNNLKVIVDIFIPRFQINNNPYLNEAENSKLKENVTKLVRKYKNHPAILFWNLGNELQYPVILKKHRIVQNFNDIIDIIKTIRNRKSFIRTFNNLIDIIHQEDSSHLVSTSVATNYFWKKALSIHLHSPKLDVIGINVFGPVENTKYQITMLSKIIKFKPYYISEWGIAGPWEQEMTSWIAPIEPTSTKKSEQYAGKYKKLKNIDEKSLGTVVFYWGQKQERTHTWFNIFDENGRKSKAYYDLKKIWLDNSNSESDPPLIKYMLVDQKGAKDNLIFKGGEIKNANLFMTSEIDSTFKFNWEIYEEGWNYEGGGAAHKLTKRIDTFFDNAKSRKVKFIVPDKEGPYRMFAYVYDNNGNFATTNTPFYVLNPDE